VTSSGTPVHTAQSVRGSSFYTPVGVTSSGTGQISTTS